MAALLFIRHHQAVGISGANHLPVAGRIFNRVMLRRLPASQNAMSFLPLRVRKFTVWIWGWTRKTHLVWEGGGHRAGVVGERSAAASAAM